MNNCYTPSPRLAEDGDYGPKTKTAVRAAQKKIGTTADGVYGPNTLSKLKIYGAGINYPVSRCIRYGVGSA